MTPLAGVDGVVGRAPFVDEAEPVGRGRIGDGRFKRLDQGVGLMIGAL